MRVLRMALVIITLALVNEPGACVAKFPIEDLSAQDITSGEIGRVIQRAWDTASPYYTYQDAKIVLYRGIPPSLPLDINGARPVVLRSLQAHYTDVARRAGVTGKVRLYIMVLKDGSVLPRMWLMKGLGYGLDEEAARVVAQWKFEALDRMAPLVLDVDFK